MLGKLAHTHKVKNIQDCMFMYGYAVNFCMIGKNGALLLSSLFLLLQQNRKQLRNLKI